MQPVNYEILKRGDADPRKAELAAWIGERFGEMPSALTSASSDASFRRYFRARVAGRSVVFMDAPPAHEDCRPFVRIAGLLRAARVHAPEVLAQDLERGFLALSDLGSTTYLDELTDANADALFADALDALIRWQRASRPDVLPLYNRALLRRELELFPQWYMTVHRRAAPDARQRAVLDDLFRRLEDAALAQPQVFVHRDYMPRNLMLSTPNPGVLDFQDAVFGPLAYDVISLFKDAFISWDEDRVIGWLRDYWQRARRAGVPVPAPFEDFRYACDTVGLQRHLKVAGIFARICHRDGKPRYVQDAPRFLGYIRATARRYAQFRPLLRLLDEVEAA